MKNSTKSNSLPSSRSARELRLAIKREKHRRLARTNLLAFILYIEPAYKLTWFHKHVIAQLQAMSDGKFDRLMVFMPPRHGKTFLVSKLFPAWFMGRFPDLKLIGASYTTDLSYQNNTELQKIMLRPEFNEVFPEARLFAKNVVTTQNAKRNKTEFDIVDRQGSYLATSVGASVTGRGASGVIICDDLIKGFEQAESPTYRDRTWKWFNSDLYTRLEKGSKMVLINTRWHEDDICGRLIDNMQEGIGDDWKVISFPALRATHDDEVDPRSIGEALWPEEFPEEVLRTIREQLGGRVFASLYQCSPSAVEGNIFKRAWFGRYYEETPSGTIHFQVDSAYTSSEKNDPTAVVAYCRVGNFIDIVHAGAVRLEFNQLADFLVRYVAQYGKHNSKVYIEPKASGLSLIQYLRHETELNIIKDKAPKDSKVVRAQVATGPIEAGRLRLPILSKESSWQKELIDELCAFPSAQHDDLTDCITAIIHREFTGGRVSSMRATNARGGVRYRAGDRRALRGAERRAKGEMK